MLRFFDSIMQDFGFANVNEFVSSMLKHDKIATLNVNGKILSGIYLTASTFIYHFLGLTFETFVVLLMIFVIELITGIWGSNTLGIKITSKKLSRFGLKVCVWIFLIMVMKVFGDFYQDDAIGNIFQLFHSLSVVYIIGIYTYSIGENVDKITGGSGEFTFFMKKFKNKLFGKIDSKESQPPGKKKDKKNPK